MTKSLKDILSRLAARKTLSADETQIAVSTIMDGGATEGEIGAFLMALAARGETVDELLGAARAMRAHATRVEAPSDAVDTCGTGGDGQHTLNISTAAAIVAAGAGLRVAKHGNRALTSRAGSADVLEALGVRLELPAEMVARAISEIGIGFMLAPLHHQAMKHVAPVRRALGFRTLFNLLGPLCNPAGARRQLIGVFAPEWLEPLAEVLRGLGTERAWVVHGGGLDEITTTDVTEIASLEDGHITRMRIDAQDYGLKRVHISDLKGGDAAQNAEAMRALLKGAHGAYRDIVLINTAAALLIGGKADDLGQGLALAARSIESGAAAAKLAALVAFTQGAAR